MAKVKLKLATVLLAGGVGVSSITASAETNISYFMNNAYYTISTCSTAVGYDNHIYGYAKMDGYYVQIGVYTYTKANVDGNGLIEVPAVYLEGDRSFNIASEQWDNSDGYLLTKAEFNYFYGTYMNAMEWIGAVSLAP